MNITYREANNSDIQAIVHIILEAFSQYKNDLVPPSGAHKETIKTIEEKMKEGGAYIADNKTESIGCALWKRNEDNLYIGRLAVLPKYRKFGIGSQLIKILEKKAENIGYKKVLIGVRTSMPKLIPFPRLLRSGTTQQYQCDDSRSELRQ